MDQATRSNFGLTRCALGLANSVLICLKWPFQPSILAFDTCDIYNWQLANVWLPEVTEVSSTDATNAATDQLLSLQDLTCTLAPSVMIRKCMEYRVCGNEEDSCL